MPFCRNCGAQFTEGTRFCQNCGAALEAPAVPTPAAAAISVPRKDTGVTALIAGFGGLFLFGLGHFYVGKIGRGVVFLVIGFLLKIPFALLIPSAIAEMIWTEAGLGAAGGALVLLALLNLGLWIWQIYDPYSLAKKYNAEVERTGKPPW